MQLKEVQDKAGEKEFLQVPVVLYRNDPNYIRPLDQDVTDVFNPKKTKPSATARPAAGSYTTIRETRQDE